jgi:monovalent cation:H+ antiporter-2, CPA2 family
MRVHPNVSIHFSEPLPPVNSFSLSPTLSSSKLTGIAPSAAACLLAIGATTGKIAALVPIMLIIGRRVIPWIVHYVAHTGSWELFRLSVLAIALGVAFAAAELLGVSFALGAFFAGMILSESALCPAHG